MTPAPARLEALLRLVVLGLATALPAHAETPRVGGVWLCPSSEGRALVVAWIGRVERWADHGIEGALGETVLLHVQMQAQEGGKLARAGHAPFEVSAIEGCSPMGPEAFAPDEAAFEEGYGYWREAVRGGGAGAFTLPLADAYWAVIGIRDEAIRS